MPAALRAQVQHAEELMFEAVSVLLSRKLVRAPNDIATQLRGRSRVPKPCGALVATCVPRIATREERRRRAALQIDLGIRRFSAGPMPGRDSFTPKLGRQQRPPTRRIIED